MKFIVIYFILFLFIYLFIYYVELIVYCIRCYMFDLNRTNIFTMYLTITNFYFLKTNCIYSETNFYYNENYISTANVRYFESFIDSRLMPMISK